MIREKGGMDMGCNGNCGSCGSCSSCGGCARQLVITEKELDFLFEKGAIAISFADRKKYYDRYQEIIYDEKPMIYLYSPLRITAIKNKFKNVYPTSLGGVLHNLEEIYIDLEDKNGNN